MSRPSLFAAIALLIGTSAFPQLSGWYADWVYGPVRHLMTKEELRRWKAIHTDEEAEAFIDLFWAKRDPTPSTPRNEFHEEFDARVALADDQFSNGRERGAMTDPGKVIVLLGPPYRVSGRAGAPSVSSLGPIPATAPRDSQGGVLVPNPVRESNRQVWTYAHDRKPRFIPQSDFILVFLDEGNNDWKLAYTERTNPDMILQEAVNGLIVSPALTKAPFRAGPTSAHLRSKSFRDLFLETSYKQFRSAGQSKSGPATLTWGECVTPAGEHFVSLQLYAAAGAEITAGQKVNFFSVLENTSGDIVDVDETPTTMIASGSDAYVDKSVPVDPGTYMATLGLSAEGHLITATRVPMNIEKLDPAAPGISPLLLSSNIYPLKTPYGQMDPFTFGGLKVVPKGDSLFTTRGDLWYFVELRNPGVGNEGAPKIRVAIDIEGRTATGPAEMKFPLQDARAASVSGSPNRYALGLAIPLEGFIPGDYTLRLHVVDTILGRNYDLEKAFRVRPSS